MSRRQLNTSDQTDQSTNSLSESIRSLAIATLKLAKEPFTEEELRNSTSKQVLQRMLSTKSYISTTSSFAEKHNAAHSDAALRRFEELGKGQCGTVYGLLGTPTVTKLPNSESKVEQLHADYLMHLRIQEAIQEHDPDHEFSVRVPKLDAWWSPTSRFWAECGLLFDPSVNGNTFALVSERVLPAPLPVRNALVDALLPTIIKHRKEEFLARPENKNCLIRMYLGRRHTTKMQDRVQNLKLQNFPLHVNEMEDLGLDTAHFASLMANTLAIMHWGAMVDGNDVEFILGSSPARIRTLKPKEAEALTMWQLSDAMDIDFARRTMEMWLIDFNQCAPIQDDKAGIDKLVKAFIFNDPYYPRPNQSDAHDKELWAVFREAYLDMSQTLTESSSPKTFIARVEQESKKKNIDSLF
ncbi:zinc finger protein-domain-containing protein [Colletotrichum cereale]|nr:zinc finger protein-domain-containing protein [Colletotrichum cereale]